MRLKQEKTRAIILSKAKQEFLAKGFRDASLREIAKKAGATTGAIYTYFKNKDEILEILISPVLQKIDQTLNLQEVSYEEMKLSEQDLKLWFTRYIRFLLDILEKYPDEMKLLFICSEGSKYSSYKDELIRIGKERGKKDFLKLNRTKEFKGQVLSDVFIHNLVNFVFGSITEILKNKFNKMEIEKFENEITAFLFNGWMGLVEI